MKKEGFHGPAVAINVISDIHRAFGRPTVVMPFLFIGRNTWVLAFLLRFCVLVVCVLIERAFFCVDSDVFAGFCLTRLMAVCFSVHLQAKRLRGEVGACVLIGWRY